jgi:hypothetical protein
MYFCALGNKNAIDLLNNNENYSDIFYEKHYKLNQTIMDFKFTVV